MIWKFVPLLYLVQYHYASLYVLYMITLYLVVVILDTLGYVILTCGNASLQY